MRYRDGELRVSWNKEGISRSELFAGLSIFVLHGAFAGRHFDIFRKFPGFELMDVGAKDGEDLLGSIGQGDFVGDDHFLIRTARATKRSYLFECRDRSGGVAKRWRICGKEFSVSFPTGGFSEVLGIEPVVDWNSDDTAKSSPGALASAFG